MKITSNRNGTQFELEAQEILDALMADENKGLFALNDLLMELRNRRNKVENVAMFAKEYSQVPDSPPPQKKGEVNPKRHYRKRKSKKRKYTRHVNGEQKILPKITAMPAATKTMPVIEKEPPIVPARRGQTHDVFINV